MKTQTSFVKNVVSHFLAKKETEDMSTCLGFLSFFLGGGGGTSLAEYGRPADALNVHLGDCVCLT